MIATWVVGLVAVAVWQTVHPTFPRVRMPLPGSVVAAELPGGTPVWVAANDDGTVAIFEAISTHRASGLDWAVGWCQEEDAFIDYWGASRWDRRGRYVGGPAPSNLTAYEVVDIDHGSVAVGDRVVVPRRTFGGAGPLGGVCTDRDRDAVENPDPATWGRYHVANDAQGLSLAQATATRGRVVLEGVAVSSPTSWSCRAPGSSALPDVRHGHDMRLAAARGTNLSHNQGRPHGPRSSETDDAAVRP
ncbi:MAG: hypothetical protein M3425_11950 [Actinomycetota bacterium]|nr:hypothetical protein [Actinomycetota bacterium]